ncbi:Nucleoside-diphosphate-sugar epimerase [Haloechinothrix alba]|uniref:Nucleoside-diphosphate-sugar epimerase n=1 Tax=Haloechinothrix alba TaxID=664784 RepID=A0A238V1Q9_9PSEU|nr:NAD(P)H-binding protein [Haloechinothrix alba]SNR28206.1 Nucleoside-diphosphate-sugar epimerase [Haloechinothrix alba]
MRVVIAGGHGLIGLRLARLLCERGDEVCGIIRNPAHRDDLSAVGASSEVCDLEGAGVDEVSAILTGADAAVFAAGAGPGSGAARKETVDRDASVLLADAAERAGVRRLVQISAIALDRADDPAVGEVFAAYLRAKAAAEQDLRARDLDWTILRPGRLGDAQGTGRVWLAEQVDRGEVSRDDVAGVLRALLDAPETAGMTLELVAGETPVAEAVRAVTRSRR